MRRAAHLVFIVTWSCILSGCLDDLVGTQHKTQLSATLDANSCPAAGTVEVKFDGAVVGDLTPGQSITNEVEAGTHTLSAHSFTEDGYVWPEYNADVKAKSTFSFAFTCTKASVRLGVMNDCPAPTTSISMEIDGHSLGNVAPGSFATGEAIAGPHSLQGFTDDGRTLGPIRPSLKPGESFDFTFDCRTS